MKIRLTRFLPICVMSTVGLGPMAAMAVSYTDVDKCQMLIRDFRRDSYFSTRPEVEDAKKIRDEAEALCKKGKPAEGVQRMIDAFNKAGLKVPEY
jgi:hypothetical protein